MSDYEFKNTALAKLYEKFMNNGPWLTVKPVDGMLEVFIECDEKLADIQDQCEHWKTMYGNACGDQDVLKESIRLLDTENRRLRQKVSDHKSLQDLNLDIIAKHNEDMRQLREENDELKKRCEDLLKHNVDVITVNNKTIDQLREDNKTLASAVSGKDNELQYLQRENDELKKDCAYMTNSRDAWRTRAKHAEAEVEELKKKLDLVQHAYNGASKDRDSKAEAVVKLANKRDQLQEALDNIRAELEAKVKRMDEITSDRVKLSEENRKLKARTDCLRMEVEWYRKHYKEQSDKIKELKKQLDELASTYQKLTIENKRLQNNVRNCYDQGQTDLWVKLQNVNDSQPFELATCFPDVTGMEDIISWDLEDFLDAYKSWQETNEQKRIKYMRDYVERFCIGRLCTRCPLHADGFTCGRNKWLFGVPDKDVKKYYEKARSCGAYNLKDGKLFIHDLSHPMAGVNEAIKNACDRFTKPVEAANINIFTRAWHGDATAEKIKIEPWSCTLEGTINVEFDRDLLEKVCGVKPDDKK